MNKIEETDVTDNLDSLYSIAVFISLLVMMFTSAAIALFSVTRSGIAISFALSLEIIFSVLDAVIFSYLKKRTETIIAAWSSLLGTIALILALVLIH